MIKNEDLIDKVCVNCKYYKNLAGPRTHPLCHQFGDYVSAAWLRTCVRDERDDSGWKLYSYRQRCPHLDQMLKVLKLEEI